ncbi:MAG: chemotaxis protein CheX [Eubacterium sp.]|nr:chemotaxis protein CheX [Eubacterium sp.]
MYAQFFGNYLLSKHIVTPEQLIQAIEEQHIRHIKVGLLAINAGLMTAEQVDKILLRQTEENKQFGELAIEENYLTKEQLQSLLKQQIPVYLLIGERLVENGFITESKLQELIASYQKENSFNHLNLIGEQQENLQALTRNLFVLTTMKIPDRVYQYLTLLFNNLVRFIGEDFLPLNPSLCTEYVTTHCSGQIINGEFSLASYLDMEEETAVSFASRFADARFKEYDEYVHASIGDFLNWQNGLFNVNMSNEESIELLLNPVVHMENSMISSTSNMILLPIAYPFGTINFILKI